MIEETNADNRDAEISHRGMQRGSGNKPCGRAHERNAGADGACADENREGDASPIAFEEGEEARENY